MKIKKEPPDNRPFFIAGSAEDWRRWLLENYESSDGIWLVYQKKDSGIPSITVPEAIDEALCFGWIDSLPNKRDELSSYLYFSPRKAKSNWSAVNKANVERLIAAGKMTSSGLKMVELAKKTGTWDALNDVENQIIPTDLAEEFSKYANAAGNFSSFPRSVKRGILEWILNAKKPETRRKRLEETARLAEQNIRANQFSGNKDTNDNKTF